MSIRDLTHQEKCDICTILEKNQCFDEMGRVHMQFSRKDLENILSESTKCKLSPIEALLNEWDIHGHCILELFIILKRLQQYEAMEILKPHIDPKYHRAIKTGTATTSKILNGESETRDHNLSMNSFEPNGSIPKIPYEELQISTNNWDEKNVLGRGGFGKVFKGTWKCTQVAIKRIEKRQNSPEGSYQQIVQSNTELQCLNSYRHDNILPLYGIGGPQPCLVYQYMSGGALDYRLNHPRVPPSRLLPWPKRFHIAVGTARGLQFLHTIRSKPLIHGDIKSPNILLDSNDDPRIGDFGLAREGPASEYVKVTRVHGTLPYLPDEFLKCHKFSTKVDTYSFGVVLFELATGATAYCKNRERRFLREHVMKWEGEIGELMDKRVSGGEGCFGKLMEVGRKCVQDEANCRPEMIDVLMMLQRD